LVTGISTGKNEKMVVAASEAKTACNVRVTELAELIKGADS
jgi:hypothetical protein